MRRAKDNARDHTKRRLRERYGIEIGDDEYEAMLERCVGDDPTLLVFRDDGSSLHEVPLRGQKVVVMLDPTQTLIKTAYPPNTLIVSGHRP